MGKVQWVPWWWVAGGIAGMLAIALAVPLPATAWAAGAAYLAVSAILLTRGLRRRRLDRFGPANAVTATRSMLVGLVTALVTASFSVSVPTSLLVALTAIALALDGVDGYVARRTRSESDLGARFDMEVDAFLLLVLCVYDARHVGWWVLTIGLLRYAFAAAALVLPWMGRTLPPRYWRKVVTAASGIGLAVIASQLLPATANVAIAVMALALMIESFGRDVAWLVRMNLRGAPLVSLEKASTASPPEESR